MRLIGKILLACLIVLVGYLLWPQKPAFDQFNPESLVRADLYSWQAMSKGRWLTYGWTYFGVLDREFRFPALASVRMAVCYTKAVAAFTAAKDVQEQQRAKPFLQDYYRIMKGAMDGKFDSDQLADTEYSLWECAASGTADSKILVQMTADQWAALAGGNPEDYQTAAMQMVSAALIYGTKGEDGLMAADSFLKDGYERLLRATQKNARNPR